MVELNNKEIKALANIRFSNHKELKWKRVYTIPFYILMTITIAIALINISQDDSVVVDGRNGETYIISDKLVINENVVINEVEYILKGDDIKKKLPDWVNDCGLISFVVALVIYYIWYKRIKKPYIKRFMEYYNERKELMS
jgi:hypothetical protein